jgi:hypothetical protein
MDDVDLKAWSGIFDVVAGQLELVKQAALRHGGDVARLKAQCFDLIVDAVGVQARRLSNDGATRASAERLLTRLEEARRDLIDVRLHLIELSQDWKCSACGRDVVAAAVVTQRAPLQAQLVCRNCGAKTALTPEGQQKLKKLFGHLASPSWDPAINGFAR